MQSYETREVSRLGEMIVGLALVILVITANEASGQEISSPAVRWRRQNSYAQGPVYQTGPWYEKTRPRPPGVKVGFSTGISTGVNLQRPHHHHYNQYPGQYAQQYPGQYYPQYSQQYSQPNYRPYESYPYERYPYDRSSYRSAEIGSTTSLGLGPLGISVGAEVDESRRVDRQRY